MIFLVVSGIFLCVQLSSAQVVHHTNPFFRDHPCSKHQDCVNFPNTDCANGAHCDCKKNFVAVESECMAIGDVNAECKEDLQCSSQLGQLSRCSSESHKCECYDTKYNGKNSTIAFRGTCYYRKNLGDRCETDNECEASFTPPENIKCSVTSENKKVCNCLTGKTCTAVSAAAVTGFSILVTFSLISLLALGRAVVV